MKKKLTTVLLSLAAVIGSFSFASCSKDEITSIVFTDTHIIGGYMSLSVGDVLKVVTAVTPADKADLLSWTSSNPAVVSVSSTGYLCAVAPGTATITASAASGVSASFNVMVSKRQISTWKNTTLLEINPGTSNSFEIEILTAPGMDEDNKSLYTAANLTFNLNGDDSRYFNYSVSGNEVTVGCSSDAPKDGSYKSTLAITNNDETYSSQVSLVAIYREVTYVKLDRTLISKLMIGDSVEIEATVSPSNATDKDIVWTASGSEVTLSPNGNKCLVTGASAGKATVKATAVSGAYASCTVGVVEPYVESMTVDVATCILCEKEERPITVTVKPATFEYQIVNDTPTLFDIEDGVIKNAKKTGVGSITVKAGTTSKTVRFLVATKNFTLELGNYGTYDSDLGKYPVSSVSSIRTLPYYGIQPYIGIAGYSIDYYDIKNLAKYYAGSEDATFFTWTNSNNSDFEVGSEFSNANVAKYLGYYYVKSKKSGVSTTITLKAATGQTKTLNGYSSIGSVTVYSPDYTSVGSAVTSGTTLANGGTLTVSKSRISGTSANFYVYFNTETSGYNGLTSEKFNGLYLNLTSSNTSQIYISERYYYISVGKTSTTNGTYTITCTEVPSFTFKIQVTN